MRWTACHDVTPCSSICHSHRTDIVHIKLRHRHENTSSITVSHRDTTAANSTFTAHGKDHWSVHEDTSTQHVARASSSLLKPSLSLWGIRSFCFSLLSLTFLLLLFANSFTLRAAIPCSDCCYAFRVTQVRISLAATVAPVLKTAAVSAAPASER